MIYSIENENLKVSVNTAGAQLWSIYSKKTQTEYIWQGDANYWTGRAYNLFPFIGRMYDGVFTYDGKTYPSRAHGLARYFEFALEKQTENKLVFFMQSNEETLKEYPFRFAFRVEFTLTENALETKYTATNLDTQEMICCFGGHPGINAPFGKGAFEDYYLEFSKPTATKRQTLAEGDKFMADVAVDYDLVDGVKIPLRHEDYLHDAIILENTSGHVSLKCDKENRFVTVKYPDFPFIGFWQAISETTPFICIEPWSALPAVDGKIVELENKPHMTRIPVGNTKEIAFTIEIHE